MNQLKLMIVSNHCISQTDANGRSLLNLLGEFKREQLYQVYSSNDILTVRFCTEYLHLSNKNAIRGLFGFGAETENTSYNENQSANSASLGNMKNALTMLLRDIVWKHSWGMMRGLKIWTKSIKPDAVILQLGDSANLIYVAVKIAKYCKIPIIIYNTEDYYFKRYDYMKGQNKSDFLFRVFQNHFRRNVKRLFRKHKTVICNCEGLKKIFDDEFNLQCKVIYTASEMLFIENAAKREQGYISYCGNLGVGRHKSLIVIAKALQRVNSSLKLEVYGKAPSKQIKKELENCEGINYHGVVSYEVVQDVIRHSRLLIHVEGFEPYTVMDTRYAFSTKLADYCCSGIPMLVYAPKTGEGMTYIRSNSLGFTASNEQELYQVLRISLYDIKIREEYVNNAIKIAEKNHDMKSNGTYMYSLIQKAVDNKQN